MKIAKDKALHMGVNFLVVLGIGIFNPYIGIVVALALSVGKEAYDHKTKGTASKGDLVADGAGIGWGVVVLLLLGVI